MKNTITFSILMTILTPVYAIGTFNHQIPQPDVITDDWDGDSIPNHLDNDDDGDGIDDDMDSSPFDRVSQSSTPIDPVSSQECLHQSSPHSKVIWNSSWGNTYWWNGNLIVSNIEHNNPITVGGFIYSFDPYTPIETNSFEICREEV